MRPDMSVSTDMATAEVDSTGALAPERRRQARARVRAGLPVDVGATLDRATARLAERAAAVRTGAVRTARDLVDDARFLNAVVGSYARRKGTALAARTAALLDETAGATLDEDSTAYAAIEATFTKMVSGAATLIVGIYVFAQISSTMPSPSNTELANATETVKSTTGNAFTLGAVAILVLVAAVILSLIGGFGRSGARAR
jgi:hypothetical protein